MPLVNIQILEGHLQERKNEIARSSTPSPDTANSCWGWGDYRSLFITATTTLYGIRTAISGRPVVQALIAFMEIMTWLHPRRF